MQKWNGSYCPVADIVGSGVGINVLSYVYVFKGIRGGVNKNGHMGRNLGRDQSTRTITSKRDDVVRWS